MPAYKLNEEAKADLIRIYQWGILQYGQQKADNYFTVLFDAFEDIDKNPLAYPAINYIREGYRRKVCGIDNIYYRITDGTVEIMAVLSRQDVENLLQKRE